MLKTTTWSTWPSATDLADVLGKDVEEHLGTVCFWPAASAGARGRLHADAGLAHVDGREPDEEGQGRHHLEVDERLHSHPAHLLEMRVAGDPDHEGPKSSGAMIVLIMRRKIWLNGRKMGA